MTQGVRTMGQTSTNIPWFSVVLCGNLSVLSQEGEQENVEWRFRGRSNEIYLIVMIKAKCFVILNTPRNSEVFYNCFKVLVCWGLCLYCMLIEREIDVLTFYSPLLVVKTDKLVTLPFSFLTGHEGRIWSLSWNPSGTLLASCSGDKTIPFYFRQWLLK